jgi:hypothetical protein
MKFDWNRTVGITLVLMLQATGCATLPGADRAPKKDFKDVPLEDLEITAVKAEKDPTTGFVVGGKNATSMIPGLKELNGRSITELEKEMRPGSASAKGFLGARERLLEILAEDNKYVVDELGRTHQELAIHLRVAAAIGEKAKQEEFVYYGRRFRITLEYTLGYQDSPFNDGTRTSGEATLENLSNGKKIHYSLLVPDMIERYGFYEGKGTPYRVDPRKIVEVFDFLKKKS